MRKVLRILVVATLFVVTNQATGSNDTVGDNGIRSKGLLLPNGMPLTGVGIGIGQVEGFRSGDPTMPNGMPMDTTAALINSFVDPEEVFFAQFDNVLNPTAVNGFNPTPNGASGPGGINGEINDHAVQVASVMVSTEMLALGNPSTEGVARSASLYSSGFDSLAQSAISTTARHIALQNAGDIRAINLSYLDTLANGVEEGNHLLTQFIDWSAKAHNTLYVVAGAQKDQFGNPSDEIVPSPNYNGITVGKSEKNTTSGIWDIVSDGNDYSHLATERNHVDILAPGVDVLVGSNLNPTETVDGTSFSAPHVTGTVALLQQYGDFQVAAGAANWTGTVTGVPEPGPSSRRHEVSKAVILNSADKLIDDGTVVVPGGLPIPPGGLLGMDRTVERTDGSNWLSSPAYDDSVDSGTGGYVPTDFQMGVGHLNAERALKQFAAGEHEAFDITGSRVPVIGWDYGTTNGDGDRNVYRFNQDLQAGSFVSITLAWDREVEFANDIDLDGDYDIGDTFEAIVDDGLNPRDDAAINDLSLYFQPAEAGNINDARAFSDSVEGNLEHIFFQVETTGKFEFWVRQEDEDVGVNQDYAVAWWALGMGPELAGDFDGNGIVNGVDLVQWEGDFGVNGDSDADMDGDTDGADFLVWQRNLTVGGAAATQGPGSGYFFTSGMPTNTTQVNFEDVVLTNPSQSSAATATVSFDVTSRPVTQAELNDGGSSLEATDEVHEFFISSDTDILSIALTAIETADGVIYQHPYGSDVEPPNPALVAYFPALGADSFISTPGATSVIGGGFEGNEIDADIVWYDFSNDGSTEDFLFARLTTEGGIFEGLISVRGVEGGYETIPFSFSFGSYVNLIPVPEPGTLLFAVLGLPLLFSSRRFSVI